MRSQRGGACSLPLQRLGALWEGLPLQLLLHLAELAEHLGRGVLLLRDDGVFDDFLGVLDFPLGRGKLELEKW